MSKNSTPSQSSRKAPNDFPLTRHPRGYWCKKVKGKLHYFGKIVGDENGQAALAKWLDTKDDLLAFTPEEIRKPLEHGTINMRAMVLLGVNCALGNTDLALLPITAVDLTGGWLDYARAKTAIARRIPLWPETVAAIKAVLAVRRTPKSGGDSALLFVSPHVLSYIGGAKGYRVHGEFLPIAKKAGVVGRSFYDLQAAESRRRLAAEAYTDLYGVVRERHESGRSLASIAEDLNTEGHTTRRGKPWNAMQVLRVLRRTEVS